MKEFLNHQQFNYEFYEYIGDGIVNTSVISYIAERFLNIKNIQQNLKKYIQDLIILF